MHGRQERESDQHRGGDTECQGSPRWGAENSEEHHGLEQPCGDKTEKAKRQRPEDRGLVGHELAAGESLLHEPPGVPGAERQDRERLALVFVEAPSVARHAPVGDERQPEDGDDDRPDDRSQREAADPASGKEKRCEWHEEGQRLWLRHDRHRENGSGRQ